MGDGTKTLGSRDSVLFSTLSSSKHPFDKMELFLTGGRGAGLEGADFATLSMPVSPLPMLAEGGRGAGLEGAGNTTLRSTDLAALGVCVPILHSSIVFPLIEGTGHFKSFAVGDGLLGVGQRVFGFKDLAAFDVNTLLLSSPSVLPLVTVPSAAGDFGLVFFLSAELDGSARAGDFGLVFFFSMGGDELDGSKIACSRALAISRTHAPPLSPSSVLPLVRAVADFKWTCLPAEGGAGAFRLSM